MGDLNKNKGVLNQSLLEAIPIATAEIVIDDNNCKYEESIIVIEPDLLEATYIATNVACFGESNGEIDIITANPLID